MTDAPDRYQQWHSRLEDSTKSSPRGAALLDKAVGVLDIIWRAQGPIRGKDIAAQSDLSRATLYRILGSLTGHGLLLHDGESGGYLLGYRMLDYVQSTWTSGDLLSVAAAELRELRDMTGETIYIGVLHKDSILGIGRFDGIHMQRSVSDLGIRKPLHCTSQGKAVLAFLPDAKLEPILARLSYDRYTDATITDPARLRRELRQIRARGFAVDDEELSIGRRCVGAPILDRAGEPVAAISLAAPGFRLTPDRAEQASAEIAEAARHISTQSAARPSAISSVPGLKQVSQAPCFRAISPIWRAGRLIWADALSPALHGLTPQPLQIESDVSSITALLPVKGGVAAFLDGHAILYDTSGVRLRESAMPAGLTAVTAAPSGQVFAACYDPARQRSTIGPLCASGGDQPVHQLEGKVQALAFDATRETLYACIPDRGSIHFMARDGTRRIMARLPTVSGAPMGLAVDIQGKVWTALWGAWGAMRLDATGAACDFVSLPVPCCTDLAFGGEDGHSLFVTTARSGVAIESLRAAPQAGHVLSFRVAIGGLPPHAATPAFL